MSNPRRDTHTELSDDRVELRLPIGSRAPLITVVLLVLAAVAMAPWWNRPRRGWPWALAMLWPGQYAGGHGLALWLVVRMALLIGAAVVLAVAVKQPAALQLGGIVTGLVITVAFLLGLTDNQMVAARLWAPIILLGALSGVGLTLLSSGRWRAVAILGWRLLTYLTSGVVFILMVVVTQRNLTYTYGNRETWWHVGLSNFNRAGLGHPVSSAGQAVLSLIPVTLVVAAIVVLTAALSNNPAKTYYIAPVRQPVTYVPSVGPQSGPQSPLYVMVTMPDGTQQMVPVAQSITAGASGGAIPQRNITMGQAFGRYWKQYATFNGRSSVGEYWWVVLAQMLIIVPFTVLASIGVFTGKPAGIVVTLICYGLLVLYDLAVVVPALALLVRRLHDTGRSGLMLLLALIPLVGAIILIVFAAQQGTPGPNQFGSDDPRVQHVRTPSRSHSLSVPSDT